MSTLEALIEACEQPCPECKGTGFAPIDARLEAHWPTGWKASRTACRRCNGAGTLLDAAGRALVDMVARHYDNSRNGWRRGGAL